MTSKQKRIASRAELEIIQVAWQRFRWLIHGFSTRTGGFSRLYGGGALNLGFTKDDSPASVEKNRTAFLKALGAGGTPAMIWMRQVHSDIIHRVHEVPKAPLVGDGLLTDTPGLILAVQTADCLPVLLVDAKERAVGIFHAGWRGTVKRIVDKGVGEMRRWFGTRPEGLLAAIGPGIHSCCYAVGEEVRAKFESQFVYAAKLFRESKESDEIRQRYPLLFLTSRAPGHSELPKRIFLDLVEANRQQLLSLGVPARNITVSDLCTSCHTERLFSHRAEGGRSGRMMAVIGIREPGRKSKRYES